MTIPPDTLDLIRDRSTIEDIAEKYVKLTKKGASLKGDCPACGAKQKFTVTPAKQIWKCFVCDIGGNDAISFLTTAMQKDFLDAAGEVAKLYDIDIPPPKPARSKRKKAERGDSFRDRQLRESGIPHEAQVYHLSEGAKSYELDRYQAATVDQYWNVVVGDDMVLHYLDLDGKPLTFRSKQGRSRPVIRVRWQNPALHKNADGKEVKYKTPAGCPSPLWLPQALIRLYLAHTPIDTLYVTEGEKKADCLTLHDMPAAGVTGIHNFVEGGEMPRQMEELIRRCQIKRVVFLLDADWQELKLDPDRDIEHRPKLFFKAAVKYRNYFQAFYGEGLELQIWLGHGLSVAYKGADDIVVRGLESGHSLRDDIVEAMQARSHTGRYVQLYDITSMSDYKLKELWHLHNAQAFREHHAEELKRLREFSHNRLKYRVTPEGDIELAQKIMPHEEYWFYEVQLDQFGSVKKRTAKFDVLRINDFLCNRGYFLYRLDQKRIRYVHRDGRIVHEIEPYDIKRFVLDFTREIDKEDVLRMLMNGSRNFFASDKLEHMHPMDPSWLRPHREHHYMIFEDQAWKITAGDIVKVRVEDLPGDIWDNRIIKFRPTLLPPLLSVGRPGEAWEIEPAKAFFDADICRYFMNTSNFWWRNQWSEIETPDGMIYKRRTPEKPLTHQETADWNTHVVCKMLAAGYVLHDYVNMAQMKAIMALDGKESEVGRSEGGTGKSIWATMFEHIIPTEVIDGKKPRLTEDPHLYENLDERTQVVVFDDCRVNLDFEYFLSQITRGVEVNPKGLKRFKIPAPKFIFTTNHTFNGEGNSFKRRQYYISFSDYYNGHRNPQTDLGRLLFHEWDNQQWNYFYNFMAVCVQTYLRYPDLDAYTIPGADVQQRQRRQGMGEVFLDWMDTWWGDKLDHAVEKDWAFTAYVTANPNQRRYVDVIKFKNRVKLYAEYRGYDFNPHTKGDRYRIMNAEYIVLGTPKFNKNLMQLLNQGIPVPEKMTF